MAAGTSKKGLKYIKEEDETAAEVPPSYTQTVYNTDIQLETIKPNFQDDKYNAGYDQSDIKHFAVQIFEQPKPKKSKKGKKVVPPEKPQSWTAAAICSLFCFFPTGICAIIAALNSEAAYKEGDYAEAKRGANVAKHLTIASMFIGFLLLIVVAMALHLHFN